jgi:cytochrome b6-f complex iron-sulfur subunit
MVAVTDLSPRVAALIVVTVMAVLFVAIASTALMQRRRTAPTGVAGAGEALPAGSERTSIDRRTFFRGGLLAAVAAFVAEFGGATLALLWPNLKGGFGSKVSAGSVEDVKNQIQQNRQPFYYGAGRFWIVPYTGTGVDTTYAGLTEQGLMALYQKCPHLGCRLPLGQSSQWFECPCHGSKYNEAGEYELGPAPTGMFRFKLTVEGGVVMVDTSSIIPGPPRGTNTIHQAPEGPFCV